MTARAPYAMGALATLAAGIAILLFAGGNSFFRGFMSDVVVVIFLYTLVKSFTWIPPTLLAISILLLSLTVETLQSFGAADMLGLTGAARTALGTTFDWMDVVAYGVGVAVIYIMDRLVMERVAAESLD